MHSNILPKVLIVLLVWSVLFASCGQDPVFLPATASPSPAAEGPQRVTLQLKWVPQTQFAGYYAAQEQGYYQEEGLDVQIRPGGPDIVTEQVVVSGQAEFGISWLAMLLSMRDRGAPLINIAQIFTSSGMRQISWKEQGIESPADLRGKRLAVWFEHEFNLLATLNKYNIDKETDVTLVQQPFDMTLFLNREVDAAAAMTYNELYQVLDAGHTMDALNIIDFNEEGTAMLEDGIFVSESWLASPHNKQIAARFLRASFKGWKFCRNNPETCVDIVLQNGGDGVMTREAQLWQMNEVNKLIWGAPPDPTTKIGYMPPELFERTARIALEYGVISQPASNNAYTHEIWQMATQAGGR